MLALLLLPLVLAADAGPAAGPRQTPLSLAEALTRAQARNARLPVAALEGRIADAGRREADALRRVQLGVDGDLIVAPGNGYDPVVTNLGEERLQVFAEKLLLDGGALAAGARQARAQLKAADALYRQSSADVEREVRESYAGLLAARQESAARSAGVERLGRYLGTLDQRRSGGQAVSADLLSTRVRLALAKAAWIESEGREEESRGELNVLLGEPPEGTLEVESLPPPAVPAPIPTERSDRSPEVLAARQLAEVAKAAYDAAVAAQRLQLKARLDVGLWGSDTTHLTGADLGPGATFDDRLRRDLGYSLTLDFSLPAFRSPVIEARIAQAELRFEQATRLVELAESNVTKELAQAGAAMAHAYDEYRLLAATAPEARDAYLDAESRYFGGVATYLEVLDAFTAAVDAATAEAQAELAYRMAEARARRFGGIP